MKVTAIEEYGLRCMLVLAKRWESDRAITTGEIADAEGMTAANAGKLLMVLRKSGLVEAERGRNGGYRLTRDPKKIYLSEILDALGEPVYSFEHCKRYATDEDGSCVHSDDCVVRSVWQDLSYIVGYLFDKISLRTLASGEYRSLRPVVERDRSHEVSENESLVNNLRL